MAPFHLSTPNPQGNRPILRTPEQVAEFLGVTKATLADWRCKGMGPAYIKVGRLIRYPESPLVDWLEARTQQAAS